MDNGLESLTVKSPRTPPNVRVKKDVRDFLEALEYDVVTQLIIRGQYAFNPQVYEQGDLDDMLLHHEIGYSNPRFRRYAHPTERPFNEKLEPPAAEKRVFKDVHLDDYKLIRMSAKIMDGYMGLLPNLCLEEDDEQHGSSVEHDIPALMTIATRIHSGIYVAEMKYLNNPELFDSLIASRDRDELLKEIRDKPQEDNVLERVHEEVISQNKGRENKSRFRTIQPEVVVDLFRDAIIPLTKEVQLLYLLNRAA